LPTPAEHAYVPNMTLMTATELLQPHIPEHAELVRGEDVLAGFGCSLEAILG